eukprot:scaffold111496_cov27-Tisochrysis_lutea.AAC.2
MIRLSQRFEYAPSTAYGGWPSQWAAPRRRQRDRAHSSGIPFGTASHGLPATNGSRGATRIHLLEQACLRHRRAPHPPLAPELSAPRREFGDPARLLSHTSV